MAQLPQLFPVPLNPQARTEQRVTSVEKAVRDMRGLLTRAREIPWEDPVLVNSYTAVGGLAPPNYMKDPQGFVRMRGIIHVPSSGATAGQTMFTLPDSYRPPWAAIFTLPIVGVGAGQIVVVTVNTDGTVTNGAGNLIASANFDLSQVVFRTF